LKPLLYVADSHLTTDDPELDSFLGFLEEVGSTAGTLYILGDLFNVWFGEPKFRMPHQEKVLTALKALSASGVVLKFVEGNRDFSIRRNYLNTPFREVAEILVEQYGGRRILATHGDEVNRDDRQYRIWKAASKSFAVYGTFRLLPGAWGVRLGEALERRLSGTNIRHKTFFPMEQCQAFAQEQFRSVPCDAIVLGHFHEERELKLPGGTLYVVPTWRGHHRYLRFEDGEPGRFEPFKPGSLRRGAGTSPGASG